MRFPHKIICLDAVTTRQGSFEMTGRVFTKKLHDHLVYVLRAGCLSNKKTYQKIKDQPDDKAQVTKVSQDDCIMTIKW